MNQIIANSLITAAIYILVSIGFSFRYSTAKFFDFSQGLLFTLSGYITLIIIRALYLNIILSSILGLIIIGLIGVATDYILFKRLREMKVPSLLVLLASLGIYIIGQNCISLYFGDGRESLLIGQRSTGYEYFGSYLTLVQLISITTSLFVTGITYIIVNRTNKGLVLQALEENNLLSRSLGINSLNVVLVTSFLSSIVVGGAGILYSIDVGMIPSMGLSILISAVIIVIIGGSLRFWGICICAIALSISQHWVSWLLGGKWMDGVTLFVFLCILLVKPRFLRIDINGQISTAL